MNSRYGRTGKGRIQVTAYKTIVFALLSVLAIMLGLTGGNIISDADVKIVEKIDTLNFKKTLNSSYPLIDTVYNSGEVSTSISGEIKGIIREIFGFDLDEPETILNSQSAYINSYYVNQYPETLVNRNTDYKLDYDWLTDIGAPVDGTTPPTAASSISTEEGNEESDNSGGEVINSEKVRVVNQTKEKIDVDALLKSPLKIRFDRKGPKVLIFHTHTTESYVKKLSDRYKPTLSSYNLDSRYNVVRVGEEIKRYLEKEYGTEVIHNATKHNYPDANSAYANSLKTVTKILKSYPSIKIVLDIHRDGVVATKPKLRVTSKANGKTAAQVMFVVGSDKPSARHPYWKENLKLAIKLQEKLNRDCPGLARPILVSKNRYNQQVSTGALIIEIGGDGNTLDECLVSSKYIARAISEVIKDIK